MSDLLDDLEWRGLVADSTDREALEAHLAQGPVTFYVGFDPTAKSLHIGHLVQLMLVRALQERGHKPLLLVGGATGLIGDPKMTGERHMNDREVVAEWVESIKDQVSKYVDTDGRNAAQIVNNYDWTVKYTALDLLRDVGKHFSVNRMLARDVVARRLESGISYTEFATSCCSRWTSTNFINAMAVRYKRVLRISGETSLPVLSSFARRPVTLFMGW